MRIGGLSPTMSSNEVRPETCFFRRPISADSCVNCRALRTPISSRSGPTGLTKKSWAPACMALTTVSMPPLAVRTMTGTATPAVRISARVSRPDRPGMTRSSRTTSAPPPLVRRSMASPPLSAWTTA
ncbi:hypothetical protein D3C72_1809230 [compost metagenome]